MKSATVYLLLSLALVLTCQLGEARSPVTSRSEHAHLLAKTHTRHFKDLNSGMSSTLAIGTAGEEGDLSSVFPSLLPSFAGIESLVFSVASIASAIIYAVAHVASYIPSTIHWALAPLGIVDFILQIAVSLCGAPLLAPLVPFATRALLALSVVVVFVPLETIRSYTSHAACVVYDWIRPVLIRYIPHYTRLEVVLTTLYTTSGLIGSVAKNVGQFVINRAMAGWNVDLGVADKMDAGVQKLLNTTVATVAADVPTFVKEVAKEIMRPTQYTQAEIETSRYNMVNEIHSRQGTMPFPPPKLRSSPPSSPSASPSASNVPPTTASSTVAQSTQNGLRSKNKQKTTSNQPDDAVEPTYLDMTHIPKLN